MKDEHEFFDTADVPWTAAPGAPGVSERVLTAGAAEGTAAETGGEARTGDEVTRLARWAPGVDTSAAGVIRHAYYEEVYLLEGELEDLTLGQTFTRGHFASRPPGMPHGPYRTSTGCLMLEIRHRPR